MALLPLVIAPDIRLSKKSEPIDSINDNIKELARDMMETMYAEAGVGLSAVQVGVLKRLITVDVTQTKDANDSIIKGEQYIMINPEVIFFSKEKQNYSEGCLSFPGESVSIDRPAIIKVKYLNLDGKEEAIEADGLLAICIQHEIDHLEGLTIANYLSHLRKELMIKRLLKHKKTLKF
jgi:peptide deformylase